MGEQCLKSCPYTALNEKNASKLNEEFIKNYDEESDK